MTTIGERLKQARVQAGLSLAQVAAMMDSPRSTLWRWEDGKSEPPIDRAKQLAGIYRVSPCWLMTGEVNPNVAKHWATALATKTGKAKEDLIKVIALLETLEYEASQDE